MPRLDTYIWSPCNTIYELAWLKLLKFNALCCIDNVFMLKVRELTNMQSQETWLAWKLSLYYANEISNFKLFMISHISRCSHYLWLKLEVLLALVQESHANFFMILLKEEGIIHPILLFLDKMRNFYCFFLELVSIFFFFLSFSFGLVQIKSLIVTDTNSLGFDWIT